MNNKIDRDPKYNAYCNISSKINAKKQSIKSIEYRNIRNHKTDNEISIKV